MYVTKRVNTGDMIDNRIIEKSPRPSETRIFEKQFTYILKYLGIFKQEALGRILAR